MARIAPLGDPRLAIATDADPRDVRPHVATAPRGASTLLIAGGIGIAAISLFLLLESNRQSNMVPSVRPTTRDRAAASGRPDIPPLYVPPAPLPVAAAPVVVAPAPQATLQPAPAGPPRIVYVPQSMPPSMPALPAQPMYAPPPPARASGEAALVIDTTTADDASAAHAAAESPRTSPDSSGGEIRPINPFATINSATTAAPGARARASMLGGRPTTVLQGTLVPAVLETALDSTRPGLARALVSRDVRGFDGTRVLIPRGSRLTGEYRSDVAQGQNRALIVWTRLVRPDGAAIALASPVADTLGRAGVKAKVDSHFFTRFASAILQSVLAVGVNLASRPNNDTVVVGLPGATLGGIGGGFGGGFGFNQNNQVTPTLKVRAGTSVSVFVARDLDFSAVETRR